MGDGSIEKAKAARNLSLIQRIDPKVVSVVGYASHVVIYAFNDEEGNWERENVEGALFVVHRNASPFYRLLVINRLNPTNLVQSIEENFEYQLLEQYLIFRNETGIRGVWFSKDTERDTIASVLDSLEENLSEAPAQQLQQQTNTNHKSSINNASNIQHQRTSQPALNQQYDHQVGLGHGHGPPASSYGMSHGPAMYPLQYLQHQMGGHGHYQGPPQRHQQHVSQLGHGQSTQAKANDPFLLSKDQMQDVLLKLIKNDRFVDLLHKEYVASQQKKHAAKQ